MNRLFRAVSWCAELTAMHERWRSERGFIRMDGVDDDEYIRHLWVAMCMRLGDEAALRILRARRMIRQFRIVGDE